MITNHQSTKKKLFTISRMNRTRWPKKGTATVFNVKMIFLPLFHQKHLSIYLSYLNDHTFIGIILPFYCDVFCVCCAHRIKLLESALVRTIKLHFIFTTKLFDVRCFERISNSRVVLLSVRYHV